MRVTFLILLLMQLSALADEVRVAVGMNYDQSVQVMKAQGGEDITSGLDVMVLPSLDKGARQGGYWRFRDFDAIVSLSAVNGKIEGITFWSNTDFDENKLRRAKTARDISALTLNAKTKKVSVEVVGKSPAREKDRVATNAIQTTVGDSRKVKTIFEDDAKLTEQEVKDVLLLARQCGIDQPAEVRTFHFLPGSDHGIEVKSIAETNGLDVAFDTIRIRDIDWGFSESNKTSMRAGKFWAVPAAKDTTHLRLYDFGKEKIGVQLFGITPELADKIIPLIAAKKVRYPESKGPYDHDSDRLKKILDSKPRGLSRERDGKLGLYFENQLNILQFRFEKGEVILEKVLFVVI